MAGDYGKTREMLAIALSCGFTRFLPWFSVGNMAKNQPLFHGTCDVDHSKASCHTLFSDHWPNTHHSASYLQDQLVPMTQRHGPNR